MLRPELVEAIRPIASRAFCALGVTRLFELYQGSQWISFLSLHLSPTPRLMVTDPWTMEGAGSTLRMLSERYHLLPVDEAAECLAGQREVPTNSAVLVTSLTLLPGDIDLPALLEEHGVPCAVYVSPGLLDRGMLPWPLTIRWGLDHVTNGTVDLCGRRWLVSSPEARDQATADATARMYQLPQADRQEQAEAIIARWEVDPVVVPGLTWDDVEHLAACEWITLGVSGYTGDSLMRLPLDRVVFEMREARHAVRKRLGIEALHLEYPWGDTSPAVRAQAAAEGFTTALAINDRMRGINETGCELTRLTARTIVPGPAHLIRSDLAGVFDLVSFLSSSRTTRGDIAGNAAGEARGAEVTPKATVVSTSGTHTPRREQRPENGP